MLRLYFTPWQVLRLDEEEEWPVAVAVPAWMVRQGCSGRQSAVLPHEGGLRSRSQTDRGVMPVAGVSASGLAYR